jgi:hypothetical protein
VEGEAKDVASLDQAETQKAKKVWTIRDGWQVRDGMASVVGNNAGRTASPHSPREMCMKCRAAGEEGIIPPCILINISTPIGE